MTCEYATFDAPRADVAPPYEVLVDRISHEVTHYQAYLKLAALYGTRVVNNPFWRIADDKFFNAGSLRRARRVRAEDGALAAEVVVWDDVTGASLEKNMRYVDWNGAHREARVPHVPEAALGRRLARRDVRARHDRACAAYDKSGQKTLIAQEAIAWKACAAS